MVEPVNKLMVKGAEYTHEWLTYQIPRMRQYKPFLQAVRDFDCGFLPIHQDKAPFQVALDRPVVTVVLDDTELDIKGSLGPDGFDLPSLARVMRECRLGVIMITDPHPVPYCEAACTAAFARKHAFVIETRLKYEAAWTEFVTSLSRSLVLIICTVKPQGNA